MRGVRGLQGSRGPSPKSPEVRPGFKVQGQFPERGVLRGQQVLEPGEKRGGLNPKEENVGSDTEQKKFTTESYGLSRTQERVA